MCRLLYFFAKGNIIPIKKLSLSSIIQEVVKLQNNE